MNRRNICRNAFFNGEREYNNKNYEVARYWYKIAIQDPKYVSKSIEMLFFINVKEGRYDEARNLLNSNYFIDTDTVIKHLGFLENMEYNFIKSRDYYEEYAKYTIDLAADIGIARSYYQLGEYERALEILKSIKRRNFDKVALYEVCLLFYVGKYSEALKKLNKVNISKLETRDKKTYRDILTLLKYKLGLLRDSDITIYTYRRLLDSSQNLLISHIKNHFEKDMDFEGQDMEEFIKMIQDKIESMNAVHYGAADNYNFKISESLGIKSKDNKNGIKVVTHLGSKDIVTIYPIVLSDEFDKEKNSSSQELMLKRISN